MVAPNDFERAVLRRARRSHTDEALLSDLVFPPNLLVKTALDTMATENRVFLTRLAADVSQKLLNYHPSKNNIQIGDAVYVPHRLTKFKPSSLHQSLGIVEGKDKTGNNFAIRLSTNKNMH